MERAVRRGYGCIMLYLYSPSKLGVKDLLRLPKPHDSTVTLIPSGRISWQTSQIWLQGLPSGVIKRGNVAKGSPPMDISSQGKFMEAKIQWIFPCHI